MSENRQKKSDHSINSNEKGVRIIKSYHECHLFLDLYGEQAGNHEQSRAAVTQAGGGGSRGQQGAAGPMAHAARLGT